MAKDLSSVLAQMERNGIKVPPGVDLDRAFDRYVRFKPDGERGTKKSGWVRLYWFPTSSGQQFITGAYGNRGDTFAVEADSEGFSPADRAAWLEQRKAAEAAAAAERKADGDKAATKADVMWRKGRDFDPHGPSHPYLERKRVGAFGVRRGFNNRLLVPLKDTLGNLRGLQYISPEGDKLFGTGTIKEGGSHLIGELTAGAKLLAFGEGYATCASAHMAMGWPVVVCFDAGNLAAVVGEYRRLYPELEFVLLADDDRHLLQRLAERLAKFGIVCTVAELRESMDREWRIPDGPNVTLVAGYKADPIGVMFVDGTITVDGTEHAVKLENAGQAKAHAVARKHKARVLTPFFADRESPATDWNDLHLAAGLDSVRQQLAAGMEAEPEKPRATARAQRGDKGDAGKPGKGKGKGKGGDGPPAVREGEMPFLERFVLIYGTTTVWDAEAREIVRLEAMKVAFGWRVDWWLGQHDARMMVPQANVVFDPTGRAKLPTHVNLFDRMPLEPKNDPAACAKILLHLYNLCGESEALNHWVTAWMAYPLQHPGAKMRTALIMHGRTEGTGKTKIAQVLRRIYGRYGTSVGQAELQRDFNDWVSAKTLVVGEEVVSRQDLAHLQGMLQALITNETVQINTKNMPIREEKNHANFLFFSNQQVPVKLNPRDRRFTVIRVEQEHPPDYFAAIDAELDNGGAEAFYYYLLNYDLQGFNEFTRPFANRDRMHLITLGMTPDQRFLHYWHTGFAGVPFCCCPAADLYVAFKAWCRVNGERFVPTNTAFGRTVTEELERMGAPPKKVVRWVGYSDKAVSDGDWKADTTNRQSLVYFVPFDVECLRPRMDDDAPRELPEPLPMVTAPQHYNDRIKKFQVALHELLAAARRGL